MNLTPENRKFIDLVQIRCPDSFGSGLLVGRGIVLTALHVVADRMQSWCDRSRIGVYLWRDLDDQREREYPARVAWPPPDRKLPADLAVLVIEDEAAPDPVLSYGYRELPTTAVDVEARGFPQIAGGTGLPGDRRELAVPGEASFTSKTTRSLTFTSGRVPALTGKPAWPGLSGGPMVDGGEMILGVMRDVPEGWDTRTTLSAEPLPALLRDAANGELRRLLRVTLPLASATAAATPAPEAHDPNFYRLWEHVYTLDREDEVQAAFAKVHPHIGQRPVELLVSGHPEDLCEEFFKRLWRDRLGPRASDDRRRAAGPAPPPLPWPPTDQGLELAASTLAGAALAALNQDPGWEATLAMLRDALARAVHPPWLCVRLPDLPGPTDLALLQQWRNTWAGLTPKDRKPLGYVLLYTATAAAPKGLIPEAPSALDGGLGRGSVALREITREEVSQWHQQMQTFEDPRQSATGSPPLSLIAFQVAERIRKREITRLRLQDVQRLLAGGADWYRTVA